MKIMNECKINEHSETLKEITQELTNFLPFYYYSKLMKAIRDLGPGFLVFVVDRFIFLLFGLDEASIKQVKDDKNLLSCKYYSYLIF